MEKEQSLKVLPWLCIGFAGFGWVLAAGWDSALFAPWHAAFARDVLQVTETPADLAGLQALLFGILGGCIAGKWVAAWWLARELARTRQRWLWSASVAGLLSWFVLDSVVTAWWGAVFNLWMVNLVPLVIVGGCLLAARPFATEPRPAEQTRGADRWVQGTLLLFAVTGLVFALGPRSIFMAPWNAAMEAHLWSAADPVQAIATQSVLSGAIGGTVLGHFLMLFAVSLGLPGAPWLRTATWTSVLAWIVPDATASVVHGAWYNLLYIDLPTVAGTALVVARLRRSSPRNDRKELRCPSP